jgi:hypothetical protein
MYPLLQGLMLTGVSFAAAAGSPAPGAAVGLRTGDTTTVTVQNDRPVPVTVYVEEGDFDHRLGSVGPDTTVTLRLTAPLVSQPTDLQIVVHPRGEFDLAADLSVRPGSHLGVVVPSGTGLVAVAPAPMVDPRPDDPNTRVTVRNDRRQEVVVFLEHGVFDTRLGSVPAQRTATLRIPRWLTNGDDVELLLQPHNGFALASATRRIRAGDHLGVVVPAF